MFVSIIPVFAEDAGVEEPAITVTIEDITATAEALPILAGEAKVKVSAMGVNTTANIAQLVLNISGAMEYKSIQYLIDVPDGVNSSLQAISDDDVLYLSAVFSQSVIELKENEATDICIITFGGNVGDSVSVSLAQDNEESYFAMNYPVSQDTISATMGNDVTANAAATGSTAIDAKITLMMDKVTSFELSQSNPGIDISIIGEDSQHPILFTTQLTENTGAIVPTLIVETKLIQGMTYTVKVSGAGYITYEANGVNFANAINLTNADFKPGELLEDGVIDGADKAKFNQILASGEYSLTADFDRDGDVDSTDARVFDGIADDTTGDDTGNEDNNGNTGDDNTGDTGGTGNTGNAGNTGNFGNNGNLGGGNGGGGGGGGGGGFAGGSSVPSGTFADLGGHSWAQAAIYKLKNKGIISGTSATTFSPESDIKRGDFILILARMLGLGEVKDNNFADVPANSYYSGAIGAAKAAGIAGGDGTNFHPEDSITRQDIMTLAYRAFLQKGYVTENADLTALDVFGDKGSIADYAAVPMSVLVKAGIIQGSDGNVNPNGKATRAEVAVMCSRLLDLMN